MQLKTSARKAQRQPIDGMIPLQLRQACVKHWLYHPQCLDAYIQKGSRLESQLELVQPCAPTREQLACNNSTVGRIKPKKSGT
jgi:hypothetical protein